MREIGLVAAAFEKQPVPASYPSLIRTLHWIMAVGFAAVWITGVLTINLEGLGSKAWDERQGFVRDLHKSLALTLVALAVVRIFARWLLRVPALPAAIPARERHLAHAGHAALYTIIFLAGATGVAIADLQEYGNSYFGLPLPQIFPTTTAVLGWRVDPWAYLLHAVIAYGLLVLVIGHVAAVFLHRAHGVNLATRIVGPRSHADRWMKGAALTLALVGTVVAAGTLRGHLTVGPSEQPRDYGPGTRPL